jgi:hypothetical protein
VLVIRNAVKSRSGPFQNKGGSMNKINTLFGYIEIFFTVAIVYFFFLLTLNLDQYQFIALLMLVPAVSLIIGVIVAGVASIDTENFSDVLFWRTFFVAFFLMCILARKLSNIR